MKKISPESLAICTLAYQDIAGNAGRKGCPAWTLDTLAFPLSLILYSNHNTHVACIDGNYCVKELAQ
jgi:hypothetical protein